MKLLKRNKSEVKTSIGVLGAIATTKRMVDVVREISFDDVRNDAMRPPSMLVLAATTDEAERIARLLTGNTDLNGVTIGTLDTEVWSRSQYDAIVVNDPEMSAKSQQYANIASGGESWEPAIALSHLPFDRTEAEHTRARLAANMEDRIVSFARHFPAFRGIAISAIVNETSVANAQFAFVSNIPALLPVVGGLLSAGADMIVLTKNQLMMVYKIAAASGRGLDDQHAIVREMIPVVGQGFLWRTAAREATTMLPLAAGTIPKVAIAFTGTYTLGRAAEVFYRFGKKPTKEQREEFVAQARELLAKLPFGKREKELIESSAAD
jgi:uncharacterized protein (DUF697 family)